MTGPNHRVKLKCSKGRLGYCYYLKVPPDYSNWWNWEVLCCYLVTKLPPTLCNAIDYSLPGVSVHGILQVKILEWVAISFFKRSSRPRDWTHISCSADGFLSLSHLESLRSTLPEYIYIFFSFHTMLLQECKNEINQILIYQIRIACHYWSISRYLDPNLVDHIFVDI